MHKSFPIFGVFLFVLPWGLSVRDHTEFVIVGCSIRADEHRCKKVTAPVFDPAKPSHR